MIIYTTGDIFESGAEILVCPVNCVGTLGKGLAKQFKERFPDLDVEYQAALRSGDLHIKRPHVVEANNQLVCLFPTKWHWREPSRYEWISVGFHSFWWNYVADVDFGALTIAVPKLGCGLGGLDWTKVKAEIDRYHIQYGPEVYIYE